MIVPGGGPFADAVRSAQPSLGYDDGAAHAMALMAMAQFGRALQSLNPALRLTASRSAISRVLRDDKVPVWSPEPMARAAALPETWDIGRLWHNSRAFLGLFITLACDAIRQTGIEEGTSPFCAGIYF